MTAIKDIMNTSPVIPVMVINKLEHAVPLANALVEGGLKVLEITLRTPVALEAIKKIKAEVPDAIVGAGTVINLETLNQVIEAGAEFIVSPGVTDTVIDAAITSGVPILPGVITPSEVMNLLEKGITEMKFFPAEAAGGSPWLSLLAGLYLKSLFALQVVLTLKMQQHIWHYPMLLVSVALGWRLLILLMQRIGMKLNA